MRSVVEQHITSTLRQQRACRRTVSLYFMRRMPTTDLPTLIATPDLRNRTERLTAELGIALKALNRSQIVDWATDAARMTGHVFVRRGVGLGTTITKIGRATVDEARGAAKAAERGRLVCHGKARGKAFVDAAKDISKRMRKKAEVVPEIWTGD